MIHSATSIYIEIHKTIPIILPGQLVELKTNWNTGTFPAGNYPVTLEIRDAGGTVLSTSIATLTVSSDIKPSKLLKGTVSVDRQSLLQGEPEDITYSVTNIGNTDLSQVELSVKTVHVVQLSVYDTLTDQSALLKGETYTNNQQLNTQNYSAKDYLVILRASISGVEETLASTYFRVEGAPSVPSLYSPLNGSDVETFRPTLAVNNASDPNDDNLTYEFEIYSDSGLTNLIVSSGVTAEGTNTTSWQTPLALTENSVYYWRARAYDGQLYGDWMTPAAFRVNTVNEAPSAPTLSSPADGSSVDTASPVLAVNNAYDPDSVNLTYNFEVALDPAFTNIVASQVGVFEDQGTTSWQTPAVLSENTRYYWRAQADDWLIVGPWMAPATFFVNTVNDAPSTPVIIAPSPSDKIPALSLNIVAANSSDPDSTILSYIFEIDTVMTFDSPDLIRSGSIPEGQSNTLWHISGLKDNAFYYARAKASDGLAESQWSQVVSFFVNTLNDPPTAPLLANPSDKGAVKSLTPTLSIYDSTDLDMDILTYEFEIYSEASMTNLVADSGNIAEDQLITSWTAPVSLTENSTYYWRTRAFDGELYSGWMQAASFMVNSANDAPSAPTLNTPAQGSSIGTLTPMLSINNAVDPEGDALSYDFEIYADTTLVQSITGISQNDSGVTSVTPAALSDNTTFTWRARAFDGDRYGAWMDTATFSIHLPSNNITATIDFDPNTLDQKSKGNWVTVYIELPAGYDVANIDISSLMLNGTVPAESWPYALGDYDHDKIPDLMVKFDRNSVINLLPNGDKVKVTVTGTVGTSSFEGVDTIRVIH